MPQPASVVGVGAATWDDLWLIDDFSAAEGVLCADAHVGMGGGPVATALCVLSRLGHACALVDVQGEDASSAAITAGLTAAGVATDHIQISPGTRSARATVLVRKADGARQIIYSPATAGEPNWREPQDELLMGARLLHLNGRHETTARAALKAAHRAGVTVSFDGGTGRCRDSIRDLAWGSHLRIVTREFARELTGQEDLAAMMRELLAPPAQLAVITDGIRGSWCAAPGTSLHHEPAQPVFPVVDTTGCGDVYHGAFLHGWLCGWPPAECAAYASALAAKNAGGLGGRYVLDLMAEPAAAPAYLMGEKSVARM